MRCWEFSGLVSSSEQDQHWEQSRLLRAFPRAAWEDLLPWCPCVGAEGSRTLLSSRGVSWRKELNLGYSKERAELWLSCSQRGREHGWLAVESRLYIKSLLQCAPPLPPSPFTAEVMSSSLAPGMLLERAAPYCLLFRTDLWCPAALSHFFWFTDWDLFFKQWVYPLHCQKLCP